jgi:hypothetical protein
VKIDRHPLVVVPPVITAVMSVLLFFFVDTFAVLARLMSG